MDELAALKDRAGVKVSQPWWSLMGEAFPSLFSKVTQISEDRPPIPDLSFSKLAHPVFEGRPFRHLWQLPSFPLLLRHTQWSRIPPPGATGRWRTARVGLDSHIHRNPCLSHSPALSSYSPVPEVHVFKKLQDQTHSVWPLPSGSSPREEHCRFSF